MNSIKNRNQDAASQIHEPSFLMKIRGGILFSGESFLSSYKSSKLWQGYFIFFLCIGLLNFVLSTSTYPIFTEIFPHYQFSFNLFGFIFWISFSPEILILSFFVFFGFWLLVSFIIAHFKNLEVKRTASALGFSVAPLLILILYLLNKFLLQSFKYEFGPLLIGLGLGWSGLSAFIGIKNLMGLEFGGLFNFSLKSIIFRRKRTYAAILGITVAVGLILTPIPIISAYYTQLSSLAQRYQYSQYLILLEKGKSNYYSSYINISKISSLKQPNIQIISPETYLNTTVFFNMTSYQIPTRGINFTIFQNFRTPYPFQILPEKSFSENQILMGNYLAVILNISYKDLPINITLSYNSKIHNVTIIGLVKTNIQYDYELLVPINLTYILNSELKNKISLIEIKLVDPSLVDSTIQVLQAENPDLDIKRENNLNDFVSNIIDRTIQSIWLLAVVIYIVMSFGMFHIMQTTIKESEFEIAILKSIGASNFQITRIYLYQSILLCMFGSILGVICGILLSYFASIIVSSVTAITIQPTFDFFSISIAIMLSISSGIVGGLYPAYSGSKTVVGAKIRR